MYKLRRKEKKTVNLIYIESENFTVYFQFSLECVQQEQVILHLYLQSSCNSFVILSCNRFQGSKLIFDFKLGQV